MEFLAPSLHVHDGSRPALRCKSMLQGLENEYDRLLAEHDALKRRLARFDPTFQGSAAKKGM